MNHLAELYAQRGARSVEAKHTAEACAEAIAAVVLAALDAGLDADELETAAGNLVEARVAGQPDDGLLHPPPKERPERSRSPRATSQQVLGLAKGRSSRSAPPSNRAAPLVKASAVKPAAVAIANNAPTATNALDSSVSLHPSLGGRPGESVCQPGAASPSLSSKSIYPLPAPPKTQAVASSSGGVKSAAEPATIPPPPDIRKVIDKTAQYVAKEGPGFEQRILQEQGHAKFPFLLRDHQHYPYYCTRVAELQAGAVEETPPKVPTKVPEQKIKDEGNPLPPELAKGQVRLGLRVRQAYRIGKSQAFLIVAAGSVCDFEGDAIVNAANEGCLLGAGVDGEVARRGGLALAQARLALPIVEGTRAVRCPTGEARLTIGGFLKSSYCIHAVGPNYKAQLEVGKCSIEDCDALLVSAYRNSMICAGGKALKSLGFALLSSSVFRGPQSLEKVLAAGVRGILEGSYPELE